MNFTLKIWRQQSANASSRVCSTIRSSDVTPEMSFLEMLDALNEDLINRGEPPVAFEHDCREDLRLVRFPDQRRGPWRPAWHYRVSTLDALLQG